jgi:hypothetical protein
MDAAVSAKSEGERFKSVNMGHIRGHSVTRLFVYCGSTRCNHSATIDVDAASMAWCRDALGPPMRREACGHVGADVRPIVTAKPRSRTGCFRGK